MSSLSPLICSAGDHAPQCRVPETDVSVTSLPWHQHFRAVTLSCFVRLVMTWAACSRSCTAMQSAEESQLFDIFALAFALVSRGSLMCSALFKLLRFCHGVDSHALPCTVQKPAGFFTLAEGSSPLVLIQVFLSECQTFWSVFRARHTQT